MFSGKLHLLLLAGLLGCPGGSLIAGDFAAPAEGPVAFRRDQVPLDAETMAGLSRHLATLAQGLDVETDENLRTIAQILALATALDPGNSNARELISAFKNGNIPDSADPVAFEKSQKKVWDLLGWLQRPEAGSEGRALAACLTDIIVVADPKNPLAESLRADGERGAWAGWVPQLITYGSKPERNTNPADDDKPSENRLTESSIPLAKARVFTMLWTNSGNDEQAKWIQVTAPLQMSAELIPKKDGELSPFSLVIGSEYGSGPVQGLSPTLLHLLKKQHTSLPAGHRVTITGTALEKSMSSGKRQSISAAAAVLASAAISGREPNATILGTIDENGAYKLPSGFWNQLQALGTGNGGRLVLPAAAADYLPSMLAFGKPQLFMNYEILLASNFKELLEMSAKKPAEPLAKASAQFQEIREKMGTQPLGQYVANSFIRRRFVDIVQTTPYHFSAKMLAIQGAGNRPAFLPRVVLSPELRRSLEPLDWILRKDYPSYDSSDLNRLGSNYESCRAEVDRLLRYAEKSDQILISHAQDLLVKVRNLERAARPHGDYYPAYDAVHNAQTALTEAYTRLIEELTAEEKVASPH